MAAFCIEYRLLVPPSCNHIMTSLAKRNSSMETTAPHQQQHLHHINSLKNKKEPRPRQHKKQQLQKQQQQQPTPSLPTNNQQQCSNQPQEVPSLIGFGMIGMKKNNVMNEKFPDFDWDFVPHEGCRSFLDSGFLDDHNLHYFQGSNLRDPTLLLGPERKSSVFCIGNKKLDLQSLSISTNKTT